MKNILCTGLLLIGLVAYSTETTPRDQFKKYWYQGKAELSRYALKQVRYGDIHEGDAVLIFVTEPFLSEKQVKLEHGDSSGAVPVLKLNFTRKFFTGIYPYSIMTSIFTPVDLQKSRTLKVTSSSQEWCGHTFMQMNLRNNHYQTLIRSYFQDEGDQNLDLNAVPLEDELWTRIRIAPDTLPKGNFQLIPASQFVRLQHIRIQPEPVSATLTSKADRNVYTVQYKNLKRQLTIEFEKQFPYAILSWSETVPAGFGSDSPMLTTTGTRTNHLLLDYWNKHNNSDAIYRQKLGVTMK